MVKHSRFRFQYRQIVVLVLGWVMLTGSVTIVNILGGLLLGWLITLLFPLPPITFSGRLRPWGVVKLGATLVWDLAVASFSLARFAFGKRMPPSGIIRVRLRSDSDLYQVLTAQLNTVVPGTVVLDARQRTRTLYLHVFDARDADRLQHEVDEALQTERRVVHALGSRDEITAIDAALDPVVEVTVADRKVTTGLDPAWTAECRLDEYCTAHEAVHVRDDFVPADGNVALEGDVDGFGEVDGTAGEDHDDESGGHDPDEGHDAPEGAHEHVVSSDAGVVDQNSAETDADDRADDRADEPGGATRPGTETGEKP